MRPPENPKIYHIVHIDRLTSILADKHLWCDAVIANRAGENGTTIGMSNIKTRRLNLLTLDSHPELYVGACVPFYFCPRSVMLFLIHRANHPELLYRGGQQPIIHFEADLAATVDWAYRNNMRWAFTLSNAGSRYFEDRCTLDSLGDLDWNAIQTNSWSGNGISPLVKESKQAEFLLEQAFPVELVSRIGVRSRAVYNQVMAVLHNSGFHPTVEIKAEWYY